MVQNDFLDVLSDHVKFSPIVIIKNWRRLLELGRPRKLALIGKRLILAIGLHFHGFIFFCTPKRKRNKRKGRQQQSPISPLNALSSRYKPLPHRPQMGRAVPGCLPSIRHLIFKKILMEHFITVAMYCQDNPR